MNRLLQRRRSSCKRGRALLLLAGHRGGVTGARGNDIPLASSPNDAAGPCVSSAGICSRQSAIAIDGVSTDIRRAGGPDLPIERVGIAKSDVSSTIKGGDTDRSDGKFGSLVVPLRIEPRVDKDVIASERGIAASALGVYDWQWVDMSLQGRNQGKRSDQSCDWQRHEQIPLHGILLFKWCSHQTRLLGRCAFLERHLFPILVLKSSTRVVLCWSLPNLMIQRLMGMQVTRETWAPTSPEMRGKMSQFAAAGVSDVSSAPPTSRFVRFGVFEIDLEACELRKTGMRMKLGHQPFEVLQLLVEHPRQVVTRDALKQRLWPRDTHVDYDLALKRLINRLRDTLGDSAESPRFIETIPRIGYRFIAPVATDLTGPGWVDSEAPVDHRLSAPVPPKSSVRVWLVLAAATLMFGLLLAATSGKLRRSLLAGSSPAPIRSLAVLPLANLSGDPGQEYFSDGMTDALITDLAQIDSLKVISRTSSMQYKKTGKSLPQIAHELKVDGIVEGTVQRSGDRLRITAQLIEGATDRHLWAKSYDRDAGEAFVLERDLTQDIAHEIQARLSDAGQRRVTSPRTTNPKALNAYLQGLYHLQRFGMGFGDEAKRTAASYLEEAIQADPNFLPAYIQLLHAHSLLYPEKEDFAASLAAAEKAVEIDPASAEAHLALGGARWAGGAWAEAEQQFRKAVALNPNSDEAHASLGNILRIMGDVSAASNEAAIAQELDPKGESLGWGLYLEGQYDSAIERTLKWRETHLVDAAGHWSLAQVYLQKQMYTQWVTELGGAMKLYGFPEVGGHLQHALAKDGPKGAMRQWAKELEHLNDTKQLYYPGVLAQIYCVLGDNDRAFYWLEHAYAHRDRAYDDPYLWGTLRIDPGFAALRSDSRYKDLMRRIGLPP